MTDTQEKSLQGSESLQRASHLLFVLSPCNDQFKLNSNLFIHKVFVFLLSRKCYKSKLKMEFGPYELMSFGESKKLQYKLG